MEISEWVGCYPSSWQGIITPEAFCHPAKFSSKLIERIYAHCAEGGWLKEGDRVVDPFGGVALGAYTAMRYGLSWVGCELEPRFVALGQQNIALWNTRYKGRLNRWGTGRLVQGDSRNLAQIAGGAECAVSSPPFLATEGGCKASGGIIDEALMNRHSASNTSQSGYGADPRNLGNLPAGDWMAAISSPPYAESMEKAGGIDPAKSKHTYGPNSQMNNSDTRYGNSPGQLGAMPAGDFAGVVSSPPYEDTQISPGWRAGMPERMGHGISVTNHEQDGYGATKGQLGGSETFWTAALEIIQQTYTVLAPGAHAVWVVKGYVKAKKLVDFPAQWREVCEACGFVTLHEHHAMLVKHNGFSQTIDGGEVEHKTESKSFFRRLAEKKGSPPINFETVLCMVKPVVN